MSTFRTAEPALLKLLESIHEGELQLPDFQRSWVWDDNHIRSLIASVTKSFPIGSVMLLESGSAGVRFKARPVEGAPRATASSQPKLLILDGQQRMTSLYMVMKSGSPVPTRTEKGKKIDRLYYLDIEGCLDGKVDREDAVVSISPEKVIKTNFNRTIKLDLRTPAGEYEQGYFPLAYIFGPEYYTWCQGYRAHHKFDSQKMSSLDAFEREVVQAFRQYRVPAIELSRTTSKEAVCQVFEKVNTGGVSLTVFELMTATFAADDFDLRKDWSTRAERLRDNKVLKAFSETDFLQAVTLLASRSSTGAASCKRRDILNLPLDQYKKHADQLEAGLKQASQLLVREKIYESGNLPYRSQLVPFSAICAALGSKIDSITVKNQLARWFWCGVFGELYGGATETRFAADISDVMRWIDGGNEPRTVLEASFSPTRLLGLQTRQSAAYKGMLALLMQAGSQDWINGDPIELTEYFDRAVDIHHIFPKAYCKKKKYSRRQWNSVINKAPLTSRTNRILSGSAPSVYVSKIEKKYKIGSGKLNEMVASHLVDPALLRADNFDAFLVNRAINLLDIIEKAIGKAVVGRDAEEVVKAYGATLVSASR